MVCKDDNNNTSKKRAIGIFSKLIKFCTIIFAICIVILGIIIGLNWRKIVYSVDHSRIFYIPPYIYNYEVWIEDPEALLHPTSVIVKYNGKQVGGDFAETDEVKPIYRMPILKDNMSSEHFIIGKIHETTELTIEVYYENIDTNENCLIETQIVRIVPKLFWGYDITLVETIKNDNFDWSIVKTVAEG